MFYIAFVFCFALFSLGVCCVFGLLCLDMSLDVFLLSELFPVPQN